MPSSDEGRENGTALMIMGWICVLFAVLVMFFNPAALKLGQARMEFIAAALVLAGLLLNIVGSRIRAHNR
jgi:hypothetical protein